MFKKILIIGAKGNLGQQLVNVFENNYEVSAWDKEELDVTDEESVLKKIKDIRPGIIVNASAYNAVDKCESDEKEFDLAKKINGGAVGYLAEAALENNAVLVHYSSDYVFGGKNKDGYKEDDEPNPISKYGETKLMGERAIVDAGKQGLKYYLVRTSKLFGPQAAGRRSLTSDIPAVLDGRDAAGLETLPPAAGRRSPTSDVPAVLDGRDAAGLETLPPASIATSKPSFFDIMLKLAESKDEIDAVDEEMSCFTYTPDLAKAAKDLIENKKPYGIYHITSSGPCTWYEAAKELFNIAGINIKVNPVSAGKFPRPAKRPKYSVLLNTKFKPMRDWREALREYIKVKSL